jgi:hypothetical protein
LSNPREFIDVYHASIDTIPEEGIIAINGNVLLKVENIST